MKKIWVVLHIFAAIAIAHQLYLHVTGAETSAVSVAFGLFLGVAACIDAAIEEIKK